MLQDIWQVHHVLIDLYCAALCLHLSKVACAALCLHLSKIAC
jgi:hypothetical protein